MAKTDLTVKLENDIWESVVNQGTFGCFEVTIGWYGKNRVDFITLDTKNIFRFYEIKVSKADFYSKSGHTFLGNYNYYVMPNELYEQVKKDIPDFVGVHNGTYCIKRPKKQELGESANVLKSSVIRSLCRDVDKHQKDKNTLVLKSMRHEMKTICKREDFYKAECESLKEELYRIKNPPEYPIGMELTVDFHGCTRKATVSKYDRAGY